MNPEGNRNGQRRSLWKGPAAVAAGFLSLLGVASWRVDDWHWPPRAFVVVGALVFGLGVAYQWERGQGTISEFGAVAFWRAVKAVPGISRPLRAAICGGSRWLGR